MFYQFAKENSSGQLNQRGKLDLPLLRTLVAICWKSRKPRFAEMKDSLVLLVHGSLAPLKTLIWRLLVCQNLDIVIDLFFSYKQKKWFLWAMVMAQSVKNHGDVWV